MKGDSAAYNMHRLVSEQAQKEGSGREASGYYIQDGSGAQTQPYPGEFYLRRGGVGVARLRQWAVFN